jgi:hypothetical protein
MTSEGFKAELAEAIEKYEQERVRRRPYGPGQKPLSATPEGRRVITHMLYLRASGYGSMMIARMLNSEEWMQRASGVPPVPAKHKGAKWHSWTVHKILVAILSAIPDLAKRIESYCEMARAERGW